MDSGTCQHQRFQNLFTAVAAPAFTAFTVSWIKLNPPQLTPALDTPPTI
tara:strand:+ start:463 stop:609 length:147 start_codon:yes stop_codon:yes gene_type:complete